ncbi:MAG: hypothetical protein A3G41_04920 [Elusimicrobia bacterium RIFCSPLOWO2_12_FULL_59_9]|nr:MAG: hypothetical protein A3G41_04920 [Elusimicrobia bacterium RIFCSPLOWO2_12_FULL_59_9]
MTPALRRILDFLAGLFSEEEDPNEPCFDPVHLGATIIAVLCAQGALFWLLWTLLVYEGGLFAKIPAIFSVVFTSKTLADYGYEGTYAMGVFEGWFANLAALLLCAAATILLWNLFQRKKN